MIACVTALLLAAAAAETNLVVNGTFEKGKDGKPEAWELPEGLCTFWVDAPQAKGKCLKIDTDVLRDEFLARQKEVEAYLAKPEKERKPLPPAKPKSPTKEPKYDTVAGVEGVRYMSDYIEVAPGQDYRLEVDCRVDGGAKTPKVFVKGYFLDPKRPPEFQRRVKYEKYLNCAASEKWQTFSTTCSPTGKTPDVKWVRVIIFAYWPPGTYYFDNVKLVPVAAAPKAPEQPKGSGR
jgi:hypothetical protein